MPFARSISPFPWWPVPCKNPKRLAAFIRRAGAADIGVWAVDGDPNMVQLHERPATLERSRADARFNRTMPLGARLKGVQFDVEPYLLTGYELATDAWEPRYVELVKALHGGDPDIAQGAAFRRVSSYEISGSATTFHGDTARLLQQLPELEIVFSAWPAFGGMALHELR